MKTTQIKELVLALLEDANPAPDTTEALTRAIFGPPEAGTTPFTLGTTYLIRTVTMAWAGTVTTIHPGFLVLGNAAWIADTGRYNEGLLDPSKFNEVEPSPEDVIVSLGAIVDAVPIENFKPVLK